MDSISRMHNPHTYDVSNCHFVAGDKAYPVIFSSQYYRCRIQPNRYTWLDTFEETIDVKSDLRYLDAHASPIPKFHGYCFECISKGQTRHFHGPLLVQHAPAQLRVSTLHSKLSDAERSFHRLLTHNTSAIPHRRKKIPVGLHCT